MACRRADLLSVMRCLPLCGAITGGGELFVPAVLTCDVSVSAVAVPADVAPSRGFMSDIICGSFDRSSGFESRDVRISPPDVLSVRVCASEAGSPAPCVPCDCEGVLPAESRSLLRSDRESAFNAEGRSPLVDSCIFTPPLRAFVRP